MDPLKLKELNEEMRLLMEMEIDVHGVLIVKDGYIVAEQYYSDEFGPDSLHRIEPLALGSDLHAEWQALLAYLDNTASFTVKVQDDTYVRAEARTKVFGFVDDVQFQMRPDQGFIAMRSASRLGLSDLGANRRRLEAIRQALEQPAGGS